MIGHRFRLAILAGCDRRVENILRIVPPVQPLTRWARVRRFVFEGIAKVLDPHQNYPDAHLDHREG